mmetsp:Transcript_50318/g.96105  ORF Transcript_50318/g.96105 Transcript_50318/m.96105 type:complete len:541 (+) Transcript_50318:181-1803(+)|eukprot:CAMPEP_0114256468 /NCGR_PEP_ID=MMETSP0058-20121206/18168_1 /TAXON_ID=36894 /ORGANISM="Pyramimonas parkeae, CCMP726" /LENGTH=540 /DNA_ID=CAMNT_0001371035 /DNA_START=104 /DNA_END=1726 /DNA_ORIENTATION=+
MDGGVQSIPTTQLCTELLRRVHSERPNLIPLAVPLIQALSNILISEPVNSQQTPDQAKTPAPSTTSSHDARPAPEPPKHTTPTARPKEGASGACAQTFSHSAGAARGTSPQRPRARARGSTPLSKPKGSVTKGTPTQSTRTEAAEARPAPSLEQEQAQRALDSAAAFLEKGDCIGAERMLSKAQRLHAGVEGWAQMQCTVQVHAAAHLHDSSTGFVDWYAVLGVGPEATLDAVQKAYRKLCLLLHPDKNARAVAEPAFKAVVEAHQHLSDADKRRAFDLKRRANIASSGSQTYRSTGTTSQAKEAPTGSQTHRASTTECGSSARGATTAANDAYAEMQSKLRTNPDDLWKREYNELREQFLREQQEKAYSGRDAYASSQPGKATGHQTTLASIKEAILKAQSQSQLNKQNLQNHDLSWTQKIHKEKSGMFTAQPPSAAAKKQSPGPRKKQRAATANINHVSSNVEKRENPLSLNSHRPRSAPKSSSMRLTPPKMDWDGVPLKGDATRGGSTSSRYRAPVSSRNRESGSNSPAGLMKRQFR